MRFRRAVEGTPGLETAYRSGLQALLSRDKARITCRDGANITGSVDLDRTLKKDLPDDPRWDYAVGIRTSPNHERVAWVEVHPASSSNVPEVLNKLRWLKRWLSCDAPNLERMPDRKIWVASGRIAIRRGSPQEKRLAAEGLGFPRAHLVLEDV